MGAKPGTQAINALVAQLNEVTGGEDTNLSAAVATLIDGYDKNIEPVLIREYDVIDKQTITLPLSDDLFDMYKTIVIVPNITLSNNDWLYVQCTGLTNIYTSGISFTYPRLIFCKYDNNYARYYLTDSNALRKSFTDINSLPSDFRYYTWTNTVTMSGTIKIYGLDLDFRKFILKTFNTVSFTI